MLLYTEGVLSRPWCLLELNAAATNNIPIVVIGIANSFAGATSDIAKICDDLPGFLSRTNVTSLFISQGAPDLHQYASGTAL